MKKRILSMLLVIVMVLSMVPVTALAAEELKVASTKSSKYVVIGVDEITLSATNAIGTPITGGKLIWTFDPADRIKVESATDTTCTIKGAAQGEVTVKVTGESSGNTGTTTLTVIQPPENLKIVKAGTTEAPASTMKVGESVQLGYTCSNADKIEPALIVTDWKVKNESEAGVLTVSDAGVLTAGKAGTAEVRFAMNGKSVVQKFTVSPADPPAPGEVTVNASAGSVLMGKSVTLSAVIDGRSDLLGNSYTWQVDSEKSTGNVTFAASSSDNTCVVTGTQAGSVTINVTRMMSGRNYEGSITLMVESNDVTIKTAGDKTSILVGEELQFTAYDAKGQVLEGVSWNSSNLSVAKFDTARPDTLIGVAQADDPVEITAIKSGYAVKKLKIKVGQNGIIIAEADDAENKPLTGPISIYVDQVLRLKAVDKTGKELNVAWYNADSNTNVTVVNGNLTGVTPTAGDVTVKIKAVNRTYGNDAFLDVKVLPKASFVKLRLDDKDVRPYDLAVGETRGLEALKDTTGVPVEGVEWKIVSGNEFAVLDGDQLTGKADGDVELTAECVGFNSQTVTIHVTTEKLNSVTIPASLELNEGQEKDLLADAVFDPVYASDKTVTFSTKDENIEIDGSKVKAKRYGTATVTGTYLSGTEEKTVKVTVTVKAAKHIEPDSNMPKELICGESMDLKAVLKDAAGNTLPDQVQWRLKNDKVIKNLVDLTANKLTAYPQSTYDFDVYLEAYIEGNDQVEVVEVPIHVIPRTTNIALKKGEEDISDKTIVLNVNDPNGITIDAVIKPSDASKVVDWQINGPSDIYNITRGDSSIVIKPVSSQKTGAITVTATAKDGTGISRQTRIEFAKMADTVVITNAPGMMRGGANIQLRTNLDEDKTITDRRVKWSVPEEFKQLASVTEDGFLDTAKVTDQQTIKVKATLIANPEKYGEAVITLCPAVKTIKVMQKVVDEAGKHVLVNVRNVVDYSEKAIELDQIAYPAGHTGSFVWDSSNKNVADFEAETSVLVLKGAGKTQITCTATDGSGARGIYNLEVVKSAGDVVIDGADELISGKNTTLTATVYTDDGVTLAANQKVTWSVEDVYGNPTKAATINSRGRLYAKTVNYGTEVVVYATSVENKEVIGEWHVNILPKKEKSFAAFLEDDDRIIEAPVYMNTNETAVISGRWYYRDINDFIGEEDCLFFSSNPAVATIDQNDGMLETKKNGSTTITVRATDPDTRNVYTAKFTLHVVNTVDHIVISKPNNTPNYVRSGSYMNLSATVWSNVIETIKADNQGVTWGVYEEDGDELVATKAAYMTSNGALVAYSVTENTDVVVVATSKENPSITAEFPMTIRPASAYTITARCMDEDSGDMVVPTGPVNLEVKAEDTAFTTEIDVKVYVSDPNSAYDNQNLPGAAIVWETSNKDIVKVVNGKLYYTGRTGKVKVTPTFKAGNVTYRGNAVTLNIMKFVDSIEVTKKYANQELYSGKSLVMYAIVDEYATTRRVTWSLGDGDEAVASINPTTGLIRAKKGLTEQETITVRATAVDGSGEYDEMGVTIYPLTTRVAIEGAPTGAIEKGDTEKLTAVLFVGAEDDQANQDAVKWTSSRSSVVSVDKEGNITAKRRGTATIKAKATDGSGKYATIKITVVTPTAP